LFENYLRKTSLAVGLSASSHYVQMKFAAATTTQCHNVVCDWYSSNWLQIWCHCFETDLC